MHASLGQLNKLTALLQRRILADELRCSNRAQLLALARWTANTNAEDRDMLYTVYCNACFDAGPINTSKAPSAILAYLPSRSSSRWEDPVPALPGMYVRTSLLDMYLYAHHTSFLAAPGQAQQSCQKSMESMHLAGHHSHGMGH